MATIEQAVRTMLLTTSGVQDANISHGYRIQGATLPAITFTIGSKTIADTAGGMNTAELTVSSIADTSEDALSVAAAVKSAIGGGTYDSIDIGPVIVTSEALVEETIGMGDEQEPAQATTVATIYWS